MCQQVIGVVLPIYFQENTVMGVWGITAVCVTGVRLNKTTLDSLDRLDGKLRDENCGLSATIKAECTQEIL